MIYTSLAVLALSASAAVSPLSRMVHMHPHAVAADARVTLTVHNNANVFQDVKVAGRSYTVPAKHSITVKAPTGTVLYADSSTGGLKRGQVITQLDQQNDQQSININ